MSKPLFTVITILSGIFAMAAAPSLQAAELKVIVGGSMTASMNAITPQFEKTTEHKLAITYGSTGTLSAAIEKGTPFDLTILGADALDGFVKQGKLVAATRTAVARSGIGVAYRNGAPKPEDRKSTRLNSSHRPLSRMPSSA